ncbi:MAG: phospholipase [Burkholderiaceae bacterium]|nr:phospholipase [Burkholderiaceae bacterium]
MKALQIYAGADAHTLIERDGLTARHVSAISAAAGGPKGLTLTRLDRFIFGDWLVSADQTIDLLGASIGAWRMATACLPDSSAGFQTLEHDYIRQRFDFVNGKRPSAKQVSEAFAHSLETFYGGRVAGLLAQSRFRLHLFTSHGRGILHRDGPWRTPIGYAAAFCGNALHRRFLGRWLERIVFSSAGELPFNSHDLRTEQVVLNESNFMAALQASCSIPFVLEAVHDIPGAPAGAYWDGGITDYHLHLNYLTPRDQVVLYPHFQRAVVPGWLDKSLKWRHHATDFLRNAVVLAPNPDWVKTLPNGKLPDRHDFNHYAHDYDARVRVWQQAADASQQLADEFAQWLRNPDPRLVKPL